jgi:hypothetical protein
MRPDSDAPFIWVLAAWLQDPPTSLTWSSEVVTVLGAAGCYPSSILRVEADAGRDRSGLSPGLRAGIGDGGGVVVALTCMSLNFPRGQETLRTQAVAAWCGPAKLPGLTGAGDMLPVRGVGTGLTGPPVRAGSGSRPPPGGRGRGAAW